MREGGRGTDPPLVRGHADERSQPAQRAGWFRHQGLVGEGGHPVGVQSRQPIAGAARCA